MTAFHRLPNLSVFDAEGRELVGMWWVLEHLPASRKPWFERIKAAPEPVGRFNGDRVWLRTDVEPLTLFNERAS